MNDSNGRYISINLSSVTGFNRTDSSIQPVSLVVELDHSLVNRNVIRVGAIEWL